MYRRKFLLTLLILAWFAGVAEAGREARSAWRQGVPLDWFVMTGAYATSDSGCAGDVTSPLCAVETLLACEVRDLPILCAYATNGTVGDGMTGDWPFDGDPASTAVMRYRVIALRRFDPLSVPAPARNRFGIAPWDVALTLETVLCSAPDTCQEGPTARRSFLVRTDDRGWYLVRHQHSTDFSDPCLNGYHNHCGPAEAIPAPPAGKKPAWRENPVPYWRLLTARNATSTSDCIGNPVAPMCATETRLACFWRRVDDLCEIAFGDKAGGPAKGREFDAAYGAGAVIGYRVLSMRQMMAADIPPDPHNRFNANAGDVAITMQITGCTYGDTCENSRPWDNQSALMRRGRYGWYVIHNDNRTDFTDLCFLGYHAGCQ